MHYYMHFHAMFSEMDIEVWSSCSSGIESSTSDIENEDKDSPPPSPLGDQGNNTNDNSAKALVSWLVRFFLLLQARLHVQTLYHTVR